MVLLPSVVLLFFVFQSSTRVQPQETLTVVRSVFDSLGLSPSSFEVRNYQFEPLREHYASTIAHAARYFSGDKQYVECIVYEFENEHAASVTLVSVGRFPHLDSMFKDYNFLFSSGKSIFLIRTGCSQKDSLWQEVVRQLRVKNVIAKNNFIKCTCGGNCVTQLK